MQVQDKNKVISSLLESCFKHKDIVQDKIKQQIVVILRYKSVLLKSMLQYVFGKVGGHDIKNTIAFHSKEVSNVIHINKTVSEEHKKLVRDNHKYSVLQLIFKSQVSSVKDFITKRMKIFAISDDDKTNWTLLIANPNYSSKGIRHRKESNQDKQSNGYHHKNKISAKRAYINFLYAFTRKGSKLNTSRSNLAVKQGKIFKNQIRPVNIALQPVLEKLLLVKYDLHNLFAPQAANVVKFSLKKAFAEFKSTVTFIPGIGNHSINGTAVLKPLTLGIVQKLQSDSGPKLIDSFLVPEKNAGEVVVNFREPTLILAPEFIKLGTRDDSLLPEILDQIVAGINDKTRRFIITLSKKHALSKNTLESIGQELAIKALGIINQEEIGPVQFMPVEQIDKGTKLRLLFSYDNLDKKFYTPNKDITFNVRKQKHLELGM